MHAARRWEAPHSALHMELFSAGRRDRSNGLFACFACVSGMPNRRFDLPPLDRLEAFEAAARNLVVHACGRRALAHPVGGEPGHRFARGAARASRCSSAGIARCLLTERGPGAVRGDPASCSRGSTRPWQSCARPRGTHCHRHHHPVVRFALAGAAPRWLHARASRSGRPDCREQRDRGAGALRDRRRDPLRIRGTGPSGTKLFGEDVVPVCSPALAGDPTRPLTRPEDLRNHVLLHLAETDAAPWLVWTQWLEAAGVPDLRPAGALHFSHYDQLIQAAVKGQGVALGRMPLLREPVRSGELVAPFKRSIVSPRCYFVLRSPRDARQRGRRRIRTLAAGRGRVCRRCTEVKREPARSAPGRKPERGDVPRRRQGKSPLAHESTDQSFHVRLIRGACSTLRLRPGTRRWKDTGRRDRR